MSRPTARSRTAVAIAVAALLLATLGAAAPAGAQTEGGIIGGNRPLPGAGFGTFVFGGGTFEQLLAASECEAEKSTFFHNIPDGAFVVWIPAAQVDAVNAPIQAVFAGGNILGGAIFTARCAATTIVLGNSITISGRGATSSTSGVTITAPGAYELSGPLTDGVVEVRAPDGAVELILAGVSLPTRTDRPSMSRTRAQPRSRSLEAPRTRCPTAARATSMLSCTPKRHSPSEARGS